MVREDTHLPRLGTEHAVLAFVGELPSDWFDLENFQG